jgi:hypothetical protein
MTREQILQKLFERGKPRIAGYIGKLSATAEEILNSPFMKKKNEDARLFLEKHPIPREIIERRI